jgi:hypothetical protein
MKSSSSIFHNFKSKQNNTTAQNVQTITSCNNNDSNLLKLPKIFDNKSTKTTNNVLNNPDTLRSFSAVETTNSNNPTNNHQRPMNPPGILPNPSVNKLGSIYQIGYLGSAILTKGKTGLGCLQQPLRELYTIYMQHGSRLIQERRLLVTMDGLTMLFNEFGAEKYLHNELASVYDVQLLRLSCEQRKDKKLYCAFLPIGKFSI